LKRVDLTFLLQTVEERLGRYFKMDRKIEEYLSTILYVITTGTVILLSLRDKYCFPLEKKIAKAGMRQRIGN